MSPLVIKPKTTQDNEFVRTLLSAQFVTTSIVRKGEIHDVFNDNGYIAYYNGQQAGLLTYLLHKDTVEVTSLISLIPAQGIGTALIEEVKKVAINEAKKNIWLITTNDNVSGIEFYKKRGFYVKNVYKNAVEQSRKIKPEIPLTGLENLPITDEIELELAIEHPYYKVQ